MLLDESVSLAVAVGALGVRVAVHFGRRAVQRLVQMVLQMVAQ
jgi:hypothetical protein